MWVKICANTSYEDARYAYEMGADAVGLIFAPSPRRLSITQGIAVSTYLPSELERIGIFVDATFGQIEEIVRLCFLTGVQLHGPQYDKYPAKLRKLYGDKFRILRVVHFGDNAAQELNRVAQDPHIDGILVDSKTADAVGGTGIAFDWEQARETIFTQSSRLKLIAAGGLNAKNVNKAIDLLQPWGVDVASGVEILPGKKDPLKVKEFIKNAKRA